VFGGLAALGDALRDEAGAWLARLGVYFGLAALASAAILQAVDGIALKAMVDGWARASAEQKQSAFQATFAVRQIEIGAAAYVRILFGVALTSRPSAGPPRKWRLPHRAALVSGRYQMASSPAGDRSAD